MDISDYISDIGNAIDSSRSIGDIEFEAKFHNTRVLQFKHVEHELKAIGLQMIKSNTEDHIFNNRLRDSSMKSSRYTKDSNGRTILITKDRIWKMKDMDRNILYAVSSETSIETTTSIPPRPDLIRSKARRTYFSDDGLVKFDLTEVTTSEHRKNPYMTSEVEIELLKDINIDNLKMFMNYVNMIKRILQEAYLVKDINTWMTPQRLMINPHIIIDSSTFDRRNLPKPRPLTRPDCVYGGILPNDEGVSYTITPKADGIRMLLVVHETFGILLMSPSRGPLSFIKIAAYDDSLSRWSGTIVDCEFISSSDSSGRILMFDMAANEGTSAVQDLDHIVYGNNRMLSVKINSRLLLLKRFELALVNYLRICKQSDNYKVEVKRFFHLSNTRDSMYKAINECMSLKLDYPVDGWIFTPMNFRYNTSPTRDERSEVKAMKEQNNQARGLMLYPSICKLKPWSHMTIDFKFSNGLLYSVMDSDVTKLQEFKGDSKFAFDRTNYDMPDVSLDDQVIEMEPFISEGGIVKLRYIRSRPDKDPNLYGIASSIWEDIHKPLTIDSLLGKDFVLLRAHNGIIKRNIIDSYPELANLIDIGSGTGGDIFKWGKLGRIIAIEPNPEHYKEFVRRVSEFGKENIRSVNGGGEDTEKIIDAMDGFIDPTRPLIISSMLSLSFFWKDKALLDGLKRTIVSIKSKFMELCDESEKLGKGCNRSVQFRFFTVEGERLKTAIGVPGCRHFGTQVKVCTTMGSNDPCEGKYGQIVTIEWPDAIVGCQTEYMVWIDELFKGIEVSDVDSDDSFGSYILSDDEKAFNSMYVVGNVIL